MKVESLLFGSIALFLFVVSIVYFYLSHDPTGTVGLVLAGGLAAIVSSYLFFIGTKIPPRPEDRGDAEIHDGAGELGFFSPSSYWPAAIAFSAAVTASGLIFGLWLAIIGVVLLLVAVTGLLFENFTGG